MEDSIVCALFIGALNMIPDPFPYYDSDNHGAAILEEIVAWVHKCVSKATNDAPFLLRKFTLFFATNFDLYRPLTVRERGHILSRVLGMLEAARCNAAGQVLGHSDSSMPEEREDRTVNVSQPIISMEGLLGRERSWLLSNRTPVSDAGFQSVCQTSMSYVSPFPVTSETTVQMSPCRMSDICGVPCRRHRRLPCRICGVSFRICTSLDRILFMTAV